jgi:outer membrane protein assembly factor BamB
MKPTLLAMPGYVAALVDDGELKIIAADGDRFRTVASYRVSDEPTWAPPVFTNGGILTKDQHLTLWSLPDPGGRVPDSR